MSAMVFIENLPDDMTQAALEDLLSAHGAVDSVDLFKDDESKGNAQVAFVAMRSGKYGRAVIAALHGTTISDHVITAKRMKGRGPAHGAGGGSSARRGTVGQGRQTGAGDSFSGSKGRGKGGGRNV